jgi:uncharacterized damage-inducible protein DinB
MKAMRIVTIGSLVAVVAAMVVIPQVQARQMMADPTAASIKTMHDGIKSFVTKAAAQVPEDKYSYQPTKDVRTMGQLFGHIANASAMICSTAAGIKNPSMGDAEKLMSKAEIQKALASAMAVCDQAFGAITTANANETIKLFGQTHSRLGAMAFNNAHNYEHYGNLVTYMRINGMVPPSSGGGE